MSEPATVEEMIAVLMTTAAGIDTSIRHLTVKLDAATLAAESVEALRVEVGDLRHEMRTLRTVIGTVTAVQDQLVDAGAATPKASP